MANDVSYFNLENDSTEYAFNDADAEVKIAQETARATAAEQANAAAISAETTRATAAEQANATAISNETTRAEGVEGSLADLTTTAKSNLVAAINEVDAGLDTLNSKLAFIRKTYTYAYSDLASGAILGITGNMFGFSSPSGFAPVAILEANAGSNYVSITKLHGNTAGVNAMTLYNSSPSARSGTAEIIVLYANASIVSNG